jgi:hypothetical protein
VEATNSACVVEARGDHGSSGTERHRSGVERSRRRRLCQAVHDALALVVSLVAVEILNHQQSVSPATILQRSVASTLAT